jgi:hypothetical protein
MADPLDGAARSAGASDEPFFSVVCTDTDASVNWQCQVLIHTWRAVGQPGEFVRLVAAPDGGPVPDHVHARVVVTGAPNAHPDTGDRYPPYNRLFSLAEWLRTERPVGTVLLLDPDMVFRAPVRRWAEPGTAVMQPWLDFSSASAPAASLIAAATVGAAALPAITWPALIHTSDLARILPRWIELTSAVRRGVDAWESDMYGFVGAMAEDGLGFVADPLTAWMNWPEEAVAGAPIIHYCQTVEDHDGEPLWSKRDYRPWEPIEVDPSRARLDYCRDLLAILAGVVADKAGGPRAQL